MSFKGRTTSLAILLFTAAAALAGCSSPLLTRSDDVPWVTLPREGVQMKQATDPIKPGEMLQFRLPDEPSAAINGLYQVAADGTIQLTGEGRVQVGGKTLDQARQMLRNVLSVNYAVQAMELTPYEFYMVAVKDGEVKNVLRVPLKDGTTVKDALQAVRGVPPEANIWVSRPNRDKGGKDEYLTVNWKAVSHGDTATNHKLRCGDYVFVAQKPPSGLQRLFDPRSSPTAALEE